MAYRFLFSLITCSMMVHGFAEADKKASEESEKKKVKPQFVGVKRSAGEEQQKKPKKVKNRWYSSKTQPRAPKKKTEEDKDETLVVPADLPHLVAATSSLESYVSQNQTYRSPEKPQPLYPRTGFQAPNGHAYVIGEWLYWRTCQEGMEFATTESVDFDFHSGFRVGLGAHLYDFDGWEIEVDYMRFIPQESAQVIASVYPQFLFQGETVAQANAQWKISLQSVDVNLGKPYYLTKTLIFNPWFGLKGVWIYQHAHFQYQGGYIPAGQIYTNYFKNNFKGAGPFMGTDLNWQLGAGFGLFGTVKAALLAGHFHNRQVEHQLDGAQVVNFYKFTRLVSPTLQLIAGIAWDRNFHKDQCHVGLNAGFETQYFWNQNQTELFTADTQPIYMRQNGDLSFYGLTLGARVDF